MKFSKIEYVAVKCLKGVMLTREMVRVDGGGHRGSKVAKSERVCE